MLGFLKGCNAAGYHTNERNYSTQQIAKAQYKIIDEA